jgi:2-polyprenyl-6-hydroxyphenyl methylase/3-demethylubiquinone-9 3-methyltransferase
MAFNKIKWQTAQWAEIRWWKNYLKDKDTDSYLKWKKDYWKGVLDEISPYFTIAPGSKVADIGCGPTGVFMNLSDFTTVAIDPLLDQYATHLKQFNKSWYPWVVFETKPMEEITYDSAFDVIFCMNAINHVKDLAESYTILTKALKPGGVLIISIDAHNYSFYKQLFRKLPGDILHPHQYDLAEYEAFLTSRNMLVLQTLCKKQEYFFNHYIQIVQKSK